MKSQSPHALHGRLTASSFLRTLFVLAGMALSAVTSQAHAASATSNLGVNASVTAKCTVTANAIAFGAYDPVATNASTPLDAQGSLAIKCTKGSTGVTIGLGLGANVSGSTRRMTDGSSNYLTYEIYQPADGTANAACAYTTVWNTTAVLTPTGVTWSASSAASFNVCGRIAAGQDATAAASYTDTVVATVNF